MKTRASLIFFVLASVLVVASSSAANRSLELRELQANRAKWEQHRIANYELRLRDEACYCLHALGYGPFHVTVKQGRVSGAVYEGERRDGYWPGRMISQSAYDQTNLIATIDEVFARAEKVISSSGHAPHTIHYDPEYGFPTLIDVDNPPNMEDAQWRLVVDRFRRVPR